MKLRSVVLPSALVLSLAVVGCTSSFSGSSENSTEPKTSVAAPAGFESYYNQELEWHGCDAEDLVMPLLPAPKDLEDYQCATVEAPMNWDDPNSEPIELALARHLGKKGENSPALFYNLGGPGGGAIDSITSVVSGVLTKQLAEHFQVVAMDPRGVGASTPIVCMTDQERDEDIDLVIDTSSLSTDELVALADQEMGDLGDSLTRTQLPATLIWREPCWDRNNSTTWASLTARFWERSTLNCFPRTSDGWSLMALSTRAFQ